MINQIRIRRIEALDSSRIAELNRELGYQTSVALVERQLKVIQSGNGQFGFVATNNNQVVGYIHGFLSIRLTTEPFVEIGGLIVDERYRKIGIGRKLVDYLEQNVSDVETMRVRCNVKRNLAHKFYLTLNYKERKEQKVFEGKLPTTKNKHQ